MKDEGNLKEYVDVVSYIAAVGAIVSFTAQMYTFASNASNGVYFALGCLMVVTAVIYSASAALKTAYGRTTGWSSAGMSWFLTFLWVGNGVSQFAHAAFAH